MQKNIKPGTEIDIKDLPLDSKNLLGKVFLNEEGKIELKEVTDGTYSAEGTLDDLSMLKGTVEDLSANRLDVDIKLTSTSSSIVVNVETKEGYPTSYSYQIIEPEEEKKEINDIKENTYTFEELKINIEYKIKVIVKNKVGLTKEIKNTIKTLTPAEPELEGMIPVVYKNNNWIMVDTTKDKWYDYENQEWANAVILNEGITKTTGQTLNLETDVRAMFVWIPRYEYKIVSKNNIEINFIPKDVVYENKNNSGYRVHPAFTFDSQEQSGIWVGKFETSHATLSSTVENNLGCVDNNCANADGLRILPNVKSLRYNNVSNMFYAVQSMDNRLSISGDLHMMKNSEWGAVAYLAQSKYGINKEIEINDSSTYLTGDGDYVINVAQSTTGNITGIYDMSGGAWDGVMGYYEPAYSTNPDLNLPWGSNKNTNDAGFTAQIPLKYYDSYTGTIPSNACNGICYGHALSETASWYGDYAALVSSAAPWFNRGGCSTGDGASAGVFASLINGGGTHVHLSFRIVISPTT